MKRFLIHTLMLMSTLVLGACGASGAPLTPTLSPMDLQSTAAAVAFTMIAETQSAIPTATPIPPTATFTNTPLPTDTPLALPSSQVTLTPAPTGNAGGDDPCLTKPLTGSPDGNPVRIRINNSTRATLTFSIYLNQTTPQGECGYRTYTLGPEQPLVINDLVEGCYTLWAWNPDPEEYFIVTNGTNCLNTSDNWVFDISTGDIRLR